MTEAELARILSNICSNAKKNEKTVCIHLFAIQYAEDLKCSDKGEVLRQADIGRAEPTEINQGIGLSKYVCLSAEAIQMLEDAARP